MIDTPEQTQLRKDIATLWSAPYTPYIDALKRVLKAAESTLTPAAPTKTVYCVRGRANPNGDCCDEDYFVSYDTRDSAIAYATELLKDGWSDVSVVKREVPEDTETCE